MCTLLLLSKFEVDFITILFLLAILLISLFIWVFYYHLPREKLIEEEWEEEQRMIKEEEEKAYFLKRKNDTCYDHFGVRLDGSRKDTAYAYDEIVRIVNLLAQKLSDDCVAYDKLMRKTIRLHTQFDEDNFISNFPQLKRNYEETKKLALEINPRLKKRIFHYKELEPFKSYSGIIA